MGHPGRMLQEQKVSSGIYYWMGTGGLIMSFTASYKAKYRSDESVHSFHRQSGEQMPGVLWQWSYALRYVWRHWEVEGTEQEAGKGHI